MSYFFVTTLQVFFCIALLSGVLWSRNDPPSLRPLTWTLLTGLIAGVLAGLFIHGSQPVQLLLVGAEVMVSLLFVLSFWWASTYPLSVAGDSDFRRCPPLGAGP